MRISHYLAANKGCEAPHAAIWVDTETDQIPVDEVTVRHVLRFGWACYQRTRLNGAWTEPEWFRFTNARDFWCWAESKARPKTRLFMFAHNFSFDAPVLGTFEILPERGWKLTRAIIESPPVILGWRREKTTIQMLDTLNWWRMPLAKIGESIGLAKLKMPPLDASAEEWDEYAKRDVEVIRVAMHGWWKFLEAYDLGGFASTLAAQALRSYRHRYMPAKILIDDDTQAIALARSALHGGRTEAFRLGKVRGRVHCVDVNSMYPAVMSRERFPARLVRVFKSPDDDELAEWCVSHCVVALVDLETKRNRFAHVLGDKLIFPTGRFTEALTTPDLADALAHGEVRGCKWAAVYEAEYLFAAFVEEFYRLRMDAKSAGNESDSWRLKILMNSLYGKFAQRGERWEVIGEAPTKDIQQWAQIDFQTRKVRYFRSLSGALQERIREGEAHDSHPAIAAHVTAYGRALLYKFLQDAGKEVCWYVDTDSLYVNDDGFNRLRADLDDKRLGALKHESTYDGMTIFGAKDYIIGGRKVTKGVRANATWVTDHEVSQEQWSTLRGLLRVQDVSAPTTRLISKHLKRDYSKGIVGKTGKISPFVLHEW